MTTGPAGAQPGPADETGERMPELYIDGCWVPTRSGGTRTIRCPADGTTVATVDEADRSDAAAAIAGGDRE